MKIKILISYRSAPGLNANFKVHELEKNYCLIGRTESDIVVEDNYVSKNHAIIYLDDRSKLCVRDLSSMNGTFIRGKKMSHAIIKVGTEIHIGTTVVTVLAFNYFSQQNKVDGFECALKARKGIVVNKIPLLGHGFAIISP